MNIYREAAPDGGSGWIGKDVHIPAFIRKNNSRTYGERSDASMQSVSASPSEGEVVGVDTAPLFKISKDIQDSFYSLSSKYPKLAEHLIQKYEAYLEAGQMMEPDVRKEIALLFDNQEHVQLIELLLNPYLTEDEFFAKCNQVREIDGAHNNQGGAYTEIAVNGFNVGNGNKRSVSLKFFETGGVTLSGSSIPSRHYHQI